MLKQHTFKNLDQDSLLQLAAKLAKAAGQEQLVIYLLGDLGAGKTTFSRGFIQALGHEGAVKSPTYTLLEPYQHLQPPVYHFDLYRLADPEELEYIGIRDYIEQKAVFLFEWPSCGQGYIPRADLSLNILLQSAETRQLEAVAHTEMGQSLLEACMIEPH